MRTRFTLLFLLLIFSAGVFGQCYSVTVNACIDCTDYLHIRNDSIWWQDFGCSPPGTHSGCGATTVNGVVWSPWNSIYILPYSTSGCTMVATITVCPNICNIIQTPAASNGWEGIYSYNDNGPSGPHNYSIRFDFFCPTVTTSADTTICPGGSANLQAGGGSTYAWSPAGSLSCSTCANPVATPSATTVYTVTATDPNNCTGTASITVNVSQPVAITPTATDISCHGANDGAVSITYTGGSNPVNFLWSTNATGASISGLGQGNYSVSSTDASGCTASASATVNEPATLTASTTGTDVGCFGDSTGSVNLSPAGGTVPYTYIWGNGETTQNISGLPSGTYTATVTDNHNCTTTASQNISQPTVLQATEIHTDVSCNNGSDGSITTTVNGGTTAYTFLWSDAVTTQNRTGLTAGTYGLTVTDAHACSATLSVTLIQPTALFISSTQVNEICFGGTAGSISLTDTGGTAPYGYLWNDGNTSQNRSSLIAGVYTVTSSDSHGCTVSLTDTITEPASIAVTTAVVNDSCFGGSNGSAAVNASGGTNTYTFLWSGGDTAQIRTGLTAGNYNVTVTDGNTCTASAQAVVQQPVALNVSLTANAVSCYGLSDGSITGNASGGTTPYTYLWNDGATTLNRNNLAAGSYVLTLTDNFLCTATANSIVTTPDSLSLNSTAVNPLCPATDNNGSITLILSGGTTPYAYLWGSGQTTAALTHLSTGNYTVTVTDANGCTASNAFVLTYDFNFTIIANPSAIIKLGQSDTLGFTLSGNAGNYTNTWSPAASLSCAVCPLPVATPNVTTLYNITVQNDSGCQVWDTVTVYVIPDYGIFVPNAFTPNGDGQNDYFSMFGNKQVLDYLNIKIFDRSGELVFESNNPDFKWDGSFKGSPLPPGVFVWELKLVFTDGHSEKLRKGSVTLLR